MQITSVSPAPRQTPAPTASPVTARFSPMLTPDRVEVRLHGVEPASAQAQPDDNFHLLPGLPQYAAVTISPAEASTAEGRVHIAARMAEEMKPFPSVTAVVGVLPAADGNTEVVVASKEGAGEESEVGGVYRVLRDLSSSPTVKVAAAQHPTSFTPARPFDAAGHAFEIRLPGPTGEATLVKELSEGGRPNQNDMIKRLVENLPKGMRVVVLMAGPSAAGKSTLAEQIKQYAGDRHVADFPGDMYFRDADDPALPKTPSGTVYWDDPQAMHLDEMAAAIAKLLKEGHADIPVYDFSAVRPGGWRIPGVTTKGMRLDQVTPLTLGTDDILVIDSLHAANQLIVDTLRTDGLPHAIVYIDAQRAEDRLVRRMVRDYETRGREPSETLSDWDLTTFPGEVHYVRPTMLNMDPAQDVALVNKFPNDSGFTREQLDHKVAMLDKYGLAPTYPALKTPDEGLDAFAHSEEKRLRDVAANPQTSDTDRAKALAAANRIVSARQHSGPGQQEY